MKMLERKDLFGLLLLLILLCIGIGQMLLRAAVLTSVLTDGRLRSTPEIISPGEDLLYEVRWTIFKIGQIRLKTIESNVSDGEVRHKVGAFIDSYDGLPFVDFHSVSSTVMDRGFFSLESHSLEKRNDEWLRKSYRLDSTKHLLISSESWQKDPDSAPYTKPSVDTTEIPFSEFQDGISLFYYARANVQTTKSVSVPTIVQGKLGRTLFYFGGPRRTVTISAVEYPIRVIELEGKAEFEGIFGLTGDFKGWFSDDSAVIPVKAQLKVILGNVDVELKAWSRADWSPPAESRAQSR